MCVREITKKNRLKRSLAERKKKEEADRHTISQQLKGNGKGRACSQVHAVAQEIEVGITESGERASMATYWLGHELGNLKGAGKDFSLRPFLPPCLLPSLATLASGTSIEMEGLR